MGDQRVRASHAELDQILKPVDDPFWNTYYPPNGWNCRCTVLQESGGKVDKKEYPDDGIADPLFNKNWGKECVVFPKSHPYFISAPTVAMLSLSREDLSNATFHRVGAVTPKGGSVWRNQLASESASDYELILRKAQEWAEAGDIVQILPRLDTPLKNELYSVIFKNMPDKYYGKCPDLNRNGIYWEHEGYQEGKFLMGKSVRRMINRGRKQANHVVITFPYETSDKDIKERLENYKGPHDKIEYIKKPE